MHELHHVLLGHTRLFPRPTPAHNLAFDAVINALLCTRFPSPAHVSFFLDIYGRETGPLRLLAPPAGAPVEDPGLRLLHELLYSASADVTCLEVFERLADALGPQAPGEEAVGAPGTKELLGSHGEEGDDARGTAGPLDADVVASIRRIVEKWPPPPGARRGRSLADLLEEKPVASATPGERVLAALRRALDDSATAGPRSAVRRPGARASGRARVYLDVSGSMDPFLPSLRAALSRLASRVEPRLGLFSTRVAVARLDDLVRGRVRTTGGTDVACLLEHVLASSARRVLVITDGYVGEPKRDLDGRVAAGPGPGCAVSEEEVAAVVRDAFARAGYGATFPPAPETLEVRFDLCLGPLEPDERLFRRVADDQVIGVGYACRGLRAGMVPLEQALARDFAKALEALRSGGREAALGPDGKALVVVRGRHLVAVSLSLHHVPAADWLALCALAKEACLAVAAEYVAALELHPPGDQSSGSIGAGSFDVGGPLGDNGLSGKKLVAEAFGTAVPIGGGTVHGKDPHKPDVRAQLLARERAVDLVRQGHREATVWVVFRPGDEEPRWVEERV